jgi:hypothetical protein
LLQLINRFQHVRCRLLSEDELDPNRIMIKSNHTHTTNNHHNHHHHQQQHQQQQHVNAGLTSLNDLDSEEAALHEFDFLTGDAAAHALGLNEPKSTGKPKSIDFYMISI